MCLFSHDPDFQSKSLPLAGPDPERREQDHLFNISSAVKLRNKTSSCGIMMLVRLLFRAEGGAEEERREKRRRSGAPRPSSAAK